MQRKTNKTAAAAAAAAVAKKTNALKVEHRARLPSYLVPPDEIEVAHLLGLAGDTENDRGRPGGASVIQKQPAAKNMRK